jgi:transcriptional regulator with XRE-family HTH domain
MEADEEQRRLKRQGANMRSMRERKGISQTELARLMSERGKPWHQSTVYRVESGIQPLTLTETEDLAEILRSTVVAFTYEPAEIGEAQIVYDAGTYVVQAWDAVAEAVFMLMIRRSRAGSTIRQHRKSGYERVQAAIEDVRARLREHPLEEAIWEGITRYEHRGERAGEEG